MARAVRVVASTATSKETAMIARYTDQCNDLSLPLRLRLECIGSGTR